MKKRIFLPHSGFTMVELLIVISIMAIFTGIGLIGLKSYTDQRSVSLAASEFATAVRLAKSRAQSQVKPDSGNCANLPLEGYRLQLSTNSAGEATAYSIYPLCGGQNGGIVRQADFPTSLTVIPTHTKITFRTVDGTVEHDGIQSGPTTITFSTPDNQNTTVTIYGDGRIEGGQ